MERADPKVGGLVISVSCRKRLLEDINENCATGIFNHKGVYCQEKCYRKCVYKMP